MAYRFKRKETIPDASRRVIGEQLAGLLSKVQAVEPGAVHDARLRTKMLRALLQLIRETCPPQALRRADAALEKIARALAPVRDAEVRLKTFDAVLARTSPQGLQRHAQVRSLLQAQAATARQLSLTPSDLRDVVALATTAQTQLAALPIEGRGWRAIGPGLTRAYRRGRKCLAAAVEDPTPEKRHEWRKQVKLLAAHLRLLQSCQPRKLDRHARQLEALGARLGTEHDLAVLRQHLALHARRSRSLAAFAGIIDLLDTRRAAVRRRADALGRKLYRAKPAAFSTRLRRAWEKWRG